MPGITVNNGDVYYGNADNIYYLIVSNHPYVPNAYLVEITSPAQPTFRCAMATAVIGALIGGGVVQKIN